MIEAVIWDFGGVFTSSPSRRSRATSARVACRKISSARSTAPIIWRMPGRGSSVPSSISTDSMWLCRRKPRALGHDVPGQDIIALLAGDFRPDMIEALRRIKTAAQDGLHHQQRAVDADRSSRRPLALCARNHGAVRSRDRIVEGRDPQTQSPHLRNDVRDAEVAPAACVYLDDLGVT